MKIKNHYIWIFALWSIASICDAISSVVYFSNGKVGVGFIFLILAVSFAFVSGSLLEKAIMVHKYNKQVEWLKNFADELRAETDEQPFEEFDNDNARRN